MPLFSHDPCLPFKHCDDRFCSTQYRRNSWNTDEFPFAAVLFVVVAPNEAAICFRAAVQREYLHVTFPMPAITPMVHRYRLDVDCSATMQALNRGFRFTYIAHPPSVIFDTITLNRKLLGNSTAL